MNKKDVFIFFPVAHVFWHAFFLSSTANSTSREAVHWRVSAAFWRGPYRWTLFATGHHEVIGKMVVPLLGGSSQDL